MQPVTTSVNGAMRKLRIPGTRKGNPNLLGVTIAPGWLALNEGREITCDTTLGVYYIDPGHELEGAHLVVMGGELYEVTKVASGL